MEAAHPVAVGPQGGQLVTERTAEVIEVPDLLTAQTPAPSGAEGRTQSGRSAQPRAALVVSLRTDTVTCRTIVEAGTFGLAVLGADQVELARVGAAAGAPKFIDEWCDPESLRDGAPRVRGALYHLGCEVVATHVHGDHTLVVSGPLRSHAGTREDCGEPLVYVDRAFRLVGDSLAN